MAKIILGIGVAQISGKIGGSVFSRNKSGAYVRTNRKGTNPNTISQQVARTKFSQGSKFFKALSSVQQQSFKDNAINYPQVDRLGNVVTLTGSQLASKFANLALLADTTLTPQECGSPVYVPTITTLAIGGLFTGGVIANLVLNAIITNSSGDTVDEVPANFAFILKATKPMSAGFTAPKKADFRVITVYSVTEAVDAVSIQSAYAAKFGSQIIGGDAKIFFSAQMVSLTTPQVSAAVVAIRPFT